MKFPTLRKVFPILKTLPCTKGFDLTMKSVNGSKTGAPPLVQEDFCLFLYFLLNVWFFNLIFLLINTICNFRLFAISRQLTLTGFLAPKELNSESIAVDYSKFNIVCIKQIFLYMQLSNKRTRSVKKSQACLNASKIIEFCCTNFCAIKIFSWSKTV